MANRKLPFGYCLRNGQVREETTEAEVVRLIFRRYGEGASYGALADELSALGCAYAPGRPWNKNMVARILQDGRYLGSAEYPRLLSPELFHQAQSARPDVSGRLECPEIKDIRVLAGAPSAANPCGGCAKTTGTAPTAWIPPVRLKTKP